MLAQGPTHTAQVKQYHASYLSLAIATIVTISLFLCIVLTRVHTALEVATFSATFSRRQLGDTSPVRVETLQRKTIIQTEYGNAT